MLGAEERRLTRMEQYAADDALMVDQGFALDSNHNVIYENRLMSGNLL